jgi:hypothetical protein
VLSFLICLAGATYFAVVASARASGPLREKAAASFWLVTAGPFLLIPDLGRVWQSARGGAATAIANAAVPWTMALVLGAVFLLLFVAANPVLENWFAQLNWRDSAARIDLARVLFWLFAVVLIWPFICMSPRRIAETNELVRDPHQRSGDTYEPLPERLFGDAAIVRALILFNLLFAVQTAMDVNYLWRGATLPAGMNYATYAHRGAYPLILTALLAAAFVIAALRPNSTAERSPMMRTLVFLWTGQNVLLVLSSMLRLKLYVEAYSLTYLRMAAFIWMLLVAAGLILIGARIVLYRSNAWLISRNLAALALTIYACGLVNFPHVVARYNVAHSREMGGPGVPLDVNYILGLGPDAIPALDVYFARTNATPPPGVVSRRDALAASHLKQMQDWRAWSFRGRRLERYFARVPHARR